MPASPYFPPLVLKADSKLCIILAPLIPTGCPNATAPPKILTFWSEISKSFELAKATTENASLN